MKRLINKLISAVIITIPLICMTIPVAAETDVTPDGNYINGSNYDEYEANPDYYSAEQTLIRERLIEKISQHPSKLTGGQKTLSIRESEQDNKYYCGPATVQIVINYKTGANWSQSKLASEMGTTSSSGTSRGAIVKELNKYIGANTYTDVSVSSIGVGAGAQYSIDNDCPLIYHVMPTVFDSYEGYTSSGHYIVGNAYKIGWSGSQSFNEVTYFDPFRTAKGSYGFHNVTLDLMTKALNAKDGHYIMKAQ